MPQPDCPAGRGSAGPACALGDRGKRGAHRLEPGYARSRIVAGYAGKPRIDDRGDAFNGERGFGNRCCQHDLSVTIPGWRDGGELILRLKRTIEKMDVGILRQA